MIIEGLSEEELKCEDYYLAYFDILGTKKSLIKNEKETFSKLWLVNNFIKKHSKNIVVRSFSDNYLFAIRIDEGKQIESLNILLNVVGGFAVSCLSLYELLVRGAITKGKLHIDSNVVLGEALIRAYELESRVAIYPRVVIDGGILNLDVENMTIRDFAKPFFKDFDSSLCVNSLFFFDDKIRDAMKGRLANNLINSAIMAYENADQKSISKVEWTKNYVNDFFVQHTGQKLIIFDENAFKLLKK